MKRKNNWDSILTSLNYKHRDILYLNEYCYCIDQAGNIYSVFKSIFGDTYKYYIYTDWITK